MAKHKLTINDADGLVINLFPPQPTDGYEEGTKVTINVAYNGNKRTGAVTGTEIIDRAVYEVIMDSAKTVDVTKEGSSQIVTIPTEPVGYVNNLQATASINDTLDITSDVQAVDPTSTYEVIWYVDGVEKARGYSVQADVAGTYTYKFSNDTSGESPSPVGTCVVS